MLDVRAEGLWARSLKDFAPSPSLRSQGSIDTKEEGDEQHCRRTRLVAVQPSRLTVSGPAGSIDRTQAVGDQCRTYSSQPRSYRHHRHTRVRHGGEYRCTPSGSRLCLVGFTAAGAGLDPGVCSGRSRPALVARSAEAALLVVGTHEHVGLARLVSGSVSRYCLSHAKCPTVIVPVDNRAVVPANFVMSRDMLQGVKRRAQQLRRTRAPA
jgi:Universal stress protein family